MNNKKFLELVYLGEMDLKDMSKFIREWLTIPESGQELYKALGMTVSQYNRWLSSPDELKFIYTEFLRFKQ